MLKEIKEDMLKELKEGMIIAYQIEIIKIEVETIKINKLKILELKSTISEMRKFTEEAQQEIWVGTIKKSANLKIDQ